MSGSNLPALVDAFDETSFLLMGTGLLISLLMLQIFWSYRNSTRSKSGSGSGSSSQTAETPTDSRASEEVKAGEGMMLCPECGKPTEAEYRYCRHCVEDTGKRHVGSGGDGESSRSGML